MDSVAVFQYMAKRIIETELFKKADTTSSPATAPSVGMPTHTGPGRYAGPPCLKCGKPTGSQAMPPKSEHWRGLCQNCQSETCPHCGLGKKKGSRPGKSKDDWACLICQMDDSKRPASWQQPFKR